MGDILRKMSVFSLMFLTFLVCCSAYSALGQGTYSPPPAVDISAYTDARSVGCMTSEVPLSAAGAIKEAQSGSVLIGRGERVFVEMAQDARCSEGAIFTICRVGSQVRRPDSRDVLGWVIDYLGILQVEGSPVRDLCAGVVKESFRPIERGDFLIHAAVPTTHCLEPVVTEEKIAVPIAAAKDSMQVIGQFSVVYLAGGEAKGLKKGMLMEILEGAAETIVGHLIVTDVSKDSSVAVVILSQREFHPFVLARTVGPGAMDAVLKKASLCRRDR